MKNDRTSIRKLTALIAACTTTLFAAFAAETPCVVPPVGLVGWWAGEGNASDQVNGNNGTVSGGVTYGVGKVGQGFVFNTTSGAVQIAASSNLNVGAGAGLTMETWINPQKLYYAPIAEWNNGSTWGAHVFILDNGTPGALFVNLRDTSGNAHNISSAGGLITTNAWQHVAVTYDKASGAVVLYRNGVQVGSGNIGSLTPQTSYNLYIGRRPAPSADAAYFMGMIDEMSLYSRALASNEIAAIFAADSAGKCKTIVPPTAPAITSQPVDVTTTAGSTVTFAVQATGTGPLSYQWRWNGANLVGQTGASLVIPNVQASQAGFYSVCVSNSAGFVVSSEAALTVNIIPSGPCVVPPVGLVGWWAGEGNASDQVNGNNGTVSGGVTYGQGKVGQGFVFNTEDGAVRMPASATLNVGAGGGLTIEAWINPQGLDYAPIAEWNNGSNDWGAHLYILANNGPGTLFVNLKDTSGSPRMVSSAGGLITVNEWQHVAVTYDRASGVVVLYRNGAQVGSGNIGSSMPLTSYDFYIGRRPAPPADATAFTGIIDEMSLYNRALKSNEIASIYNVGNDGKCASGLGPQIMQQPQNQNVVAGTTVTLNVVAGGTGPLSYQWQKNGVILTGETNPTLTLLNAQTSDSGNYSVVVSNADGVVVSADAVVVLTPLPGGSTPRPDGLVSWWAGEGDASDAVGGNAGLIQGGVGFATGEVGQGFAFNTTNGSVKIPASANLDVGAGGGLTIEAWINPQDLFYAPIVEWNNGSDAWGAHFYVLANNGLGTLFVNLKDIYGNARIVSSAGGLITSNTWQHVAVTYNRTTGETKLYRNGVPVGSGNVGTQVPQTSYDFYIGRRPAPQADVTSFKGMIDEVSLYSRALAPNEIMAIYEAGSLGKTPPAGPPVLTQGPQNQTVIAGADVAFNVSASGGVPLHYQWAYNSESISDATGPVLTLNNVQTNQCGTYSVLISNDFGVASASAVLTVIAPTNIAVPGGLVSWWAAEGDSTDTAGSNNGAAQGALTFGAGQVGQAFVFDGTNSCVKVPASPSLNVGVGQGFSIESWINPAHVGGRQPLTEWFDINQTAFGLHLYLLDDFGSGTLYACLVQANGYSHMIYSAPGTIVPNIWQHVALTYDRTSGEALLYRNAELVARKTVGSFLVQSSYDLYIGRRPGGDGPYNFDGRIDEMGLYNRALSSIEIGAIYNASSAGKDQSVPPAIALQPQKQTVTNGGTVNFSVSVSGTAPFTYQWQFNGAELRGATSATLTLAPVQSAQAGFYSVLVSNDFGSALSAAAELIVLPNGSGNVLPPVISIQPVNQVVAVGANVTWTIAATGSGPLNYQWQFNRQNLAGATNSSLVLLNVQGSQAGGYSVRVSNPGGFVDSSVATLVVINNNGGTIYFNNRDTAAYIDAPISFAGDGPAAAGRIDGSNSVPAGQYVWGGLNALAALYVGPLGSTEDQMVLAAPAVGFRAGLAAGYVHVGAAASCIVPNVPGGAPAVAQIRVWDAGVAGVNSYEDAATLAKTRGVYLGKSDLVQIPALGGAGVPPSFPANLVGLASFNVVYTDLSTAQVAAAPLSGDALRAYYQALRARPVQLTLTQPSAMGSKTRLHFQGIMGQTYFIQASANLADWVTIGTCATAIDGSVDFSDLDANTVRTRFYRVVVP